MILKTKRKYNTMRCLLIALFSLSLFFSSCKKRECKECFIEETNSETGDKFTMSDGVKCGEDLEEMDGKEYNGIDGPARAYCK
jgi:hypothetical protein